MRWGGSADVCYLADCLFRSAAHTASSRTPWSPNSSLRHGARMACPTGYSASRTIGNVSDPFMDGRPYLIGTHADACLSRSSRVSRHAVLAPSSQIREPIIKIPRRIPTSNHPNRTGCLGRPLAFAVARLLRLTTAEWILAFGVERVRMVALWRRDTDSPTHSRSRSFLSRPRRVAMGACRTRVSICRL